MEDTGNNIIELTSDIVSAFLGQNTVPATALPDLIQSIYATLNNLGSGPAPVATEAQKPAVPIKKSITPDFLISLEDGNKYKSLKRHLRSKYDLSPEQYRAKWGLPGDYPMTAPNYAAARSAMAVSIGLGQKGRQRRAEPPANKTPPKAAAKPRAPRATKA